jgi:HEPN domain-containing protein
MDVNKHINYWLTSAESDLSTAERMLLSGDYHWCLYISHLVIKKSLKAFYCKIVNDIPPRIHDLVKLANLSKLELSHEQVLYYNKVNDFNIEARYPDEKFSFYKISTKEFAEENFYKI